MCVKPDPELSDYACSIFDSNLLDEVSAVTVVFMLLQYCVGCTAFRLFIQKIALVLLCSALQFLHGVFRKCKIVGNERVKAINERPPLGLTHGRNLTNCTFLLNTWAYLVSLARSSFHYHYYCSNYRNVTILQPVLQTEIRVNALFRASLISSD